MPRGSAAQQSLNWGEPNEPLSTRVALACSPSWASAKSCRIAAGVGDISPGDPVLVRSGSRDLVNAWVISTAEQAEVEASSSVIIARVSEQPRLSPVLIKLAEWVASYYLSDLRRTLPMLLPPSWPPPPPVRRVAEQWVALASREAKSKQAKLVQAQLANEKSAKVVREVLAATNVSATLISKMVERGELRWAEPNVDEYPREQNRSMRSTQLTLTDEQARAVARLSRAIATNQFSRTLLYGVTGSGKTEVFVRIATELEAAGLGAILLVPEIALATQAIERLRHRFRTAVLWHSGLSAGQKARSWQQLSEGEAHVVIGTRSAVFLPSARLRIIVVDEEQESSYKHLATPYYNARDVATKRAQLESCSVVLASATPSLETLYSPAAVPIEVVALNSRAAGGPPVVCAIQHAPTTGGHGLISRPLLEAVRQATSTGRQAMLLLNRRGYSSRLTCIGCGFTPVCLRCQTPWAEHKATAQWVCHTCGAKRAAEPACPRCQGSFRGTIPGVQAVADALVKQLPALAGQVMEADSDRLTAVKDYERVVRDFAAERAKVLVGTQLIAKGLDFPAVDVVGVLDVDAILNRHDFRAAERAAQLLVQVSGRAGRAGARSAVFLQTSQPDHPAVVAAVRGDYLRFAAAEREHRQQLGWPPVSRLARAQLADANPSRLEMAANDWHAKCAGAIQARWPSIEIFPPTYARTNRLRDHYRMDVLWRSTVPRDLWTGIRSLRDFGLARPRVGRFAWDIDPVDID